MWDRTLVLCLVRVDKDVQNLIPPIFKVIGSGKWEGDVGGYFRGMLEECGRI